MIDNWKTWSDPKLLSDRFVEEVEQRLGIRIEHRGQGRPKKPKIGEVNHV